MSEKVVESTTRMQEALSRLPKQEAERVAYEAAIRAESVADYVELTMSRECETRPA